MNQQFLRKRTLFLLKILILATSYTVVSQNTASENHFFDKLRFGGSAGLSLSDSFFNASLSPKAIYDFSSKTSAGIGLQGSYTNASNYEAYTAGGSIIGLYRPVRSLQLSAEFEELYVSRNRYLDGGNRTTTYWYPALFLGIGYNTGPVTIGIRYDVLFDGEKSIYGNAFMPFISVYF